MTQSTALLISLIVEIPIVIILLRQLSSLNSFWLAILACGATMLTHPIAWESNQILIPYASFSVRSTLIESFVVLVEGIIYWVVLKLRCQQGLFISFIANIASFVAGLIFFSWK
ncbi:hypothetical protein RIVM261_032650 [Rivularia sp. IAM M-261]|nr:hypothetical protein RIVM261_032650 [Rivularia sp. IAM M-261]